MFFNRADKDVTVDEIWDLMNKHDKSNSFISRTRYRKNFYAHFIRLISAGHVLTFRNLETKELLGFCAWLITDKHGKQQINKVRWTLPDVIDEGNIFHITSCLTTHPSMIIQIRENLNQRFRDKVDQVMWFNVHRSRFTHHYLQGGLKCQLTAA